MAETKTRVISKRQFSFFGGIFFFLLSLVCIVNVWVIARVITLPFTFVFGVCSYFIYGYMAAQGVMLIVKQRPLPFKFSMKLIGVIIAYAALLLLFTAFYRPKYTISTYREYFDSLNYIKESNFINLFSEPVAGGVIGIILYQSLNNIAAPVPFIIGFLVFLVGLAFIFINPILALFSDYQKKAGPKPKRIRRNKKETIHDEIDISSSRDTTGEVIREASMYDEPSIQREEITPPTPAPQPISPSEMNGGIESTFSFRTNGSLAPAHFIPGVMPGDNPSSIITPARPPMAQPVQPKVEPIETSPTPPVDENPTRNEQLTLDFDAQPVIDQSVVTAQPVFEEPVAASTIPPVSPQPVVQPTPKKKIKWIPPTTGMLEVYEVTEANNANIETAEQRSVLINQILADYRIGAEVAGYVIGPSVTRYNVKYEYNVEIKAVERKVDDIARRLGGVTCRFEPMVEGTEYSGLEIPNARVVSVSFKDVFEQLPDVKKHPTSIAFGKDIEGKVVYADFASFPHMLVAGTTGSGKSIFIHSIISTLIMRNSPEMLKLVLVDPKRVEMIKYREIPHLLCPIINEPKKAKPLLDKLVEEMNRRYDTLAQGDGFSNIAEYNEYAEENGLDKIPVIIAVLDEYGDLVESCKDIYRPVLLLGQKARACGIHILIATQSPTSDILTGSIKSNLPTHVALSTSNATQSVTILGEGGAEKLLGKGDMLVQCPQIKRGALTRLQGCYIANKEISRICGYLREHYETQYDENFLNLEEEAEVEGQAFVAAGGAVSAMDAAEEAKYQGIKEYVMTQQYTSMSRIQGDCGIGFNRARRFFNRLVQEGVVSPVSEGNKGCRVLTHDISADLDSIPTSDEQSEF